MSTTLPAPATPSTATVKTPPAILAAWAILAVAAGAMGLVLQKVWAATPEMNDRFLIPCASAYLVYRLAPRWRATPSQPSRWGLIPLVLGGAAFVPGWYLLVQVGARVILQWWLLAALIAATFGLAVLHFGASRARLLAFPLLFCFFALPIPGVVYNPLQRGLQECTTRVAAIALPLAGIPVERHGYVLKLPSGEMGVVEACSGVRSVTALLAIAVLVAYLRGFSVVRGAVLFGLTFGIVAVSNSVRVIVTGLLQEYFGQKAIEGWAHQVLGILVILVGLALIVWVSKRIAPRHPPEDVVPESPAAPQPSVGGLSAAIALGLALAGCVWSEQFRAAHAASVNLTVLPQQLGGWTAETKPIDPMVEEMLKCDQLVHRSYTNQLGQEVVVYIMFWATPANTAYMHHPDVCWPCRGYERVSAHVRPVPYAGGTATLPVSVRQFARGSHRQIVYYWSQNANVLMPDGQELMENVSEYAWLASMLRGRQSMEQVARLSILIGTDLVGSPEQQELTLDGLVGPLADAIYSACPWARPAQ